MPGSVAMSMATGLLDYAVGRGADPVALGLESGLVTQNDADARVPFETYLALMRAVKQALGDPAAVLRYGADVHMAEISIVGLLMEAAPNMASALAQLHRYGRLAADIDAGDAPTIEARLEDGRLYLVADGLAPFPDLVEETFARLVTGPRRFLPRPHVLCAHIATPAPPHWREYSLLLGCPVVFDAATPMLEVPADIGSWPVAQYPSYVFGILTDRGDALLASWSQDSSYKARVAALIRPTLHEGVANAEATAALLHCSRSTLARRLREEGTTFSAVVDGVRSELALGYLHGGKTSVQQIAYLLGFSEPTAFVRAFRRWTGSTPSAYRARRGLTT